MTFLCRFLTASFDGFMTVNDVFERLPFGTPPLKRCAGEKTTRIGDQKKKKGSEKEQVRRHRASLKLELWQEKLNAKNGKVSIQRK
jgi:hypothetical protein